MWIPCTLSFTFKFSDLARLKNSFNFKILTKGVENGNLNSKYWYALAKVKQHMAKIYWNFRRDSAISNCKYFIPILLLIRGGLLNKSAAYPR